MSLCAVFSIPFSLVTYIFPDLSIDTNDDYIQDHIKSGHNGKNGQNGHNDRYWPHEVTDMLIISVFSKNRKMLITHENIIEEKRIRQLNQNRL